MGGDAKAQGIFGAVGAKVEVLSSDQLTQSLDVFKSSVEGNELLVCPRMMSIEFPAQVVEGG